MKNKIQNILPSDVLSFEAEELQRDHRSHNTSDAYRGYRERFVLFCESKGLEFNSVALIEFLTSLYHQGYAQNTITGYHAGVVDFLPELRGVDEISKTLAAIRHRMVNRPPKQTRALTLEQAENALACLSDSIRDHRDRALLSVAWSTASRASELLSLTVDKIVRETGGFVIVVKLKGANRLSEKFIPGAVGDLSIPLTPSTHLARWLEISGITEGPIWRKVNKSGRIEDKALSASGYTKIFKRIVRNSGLDERLFSPHSTRTGFVTYGAKNGHGIAEVMAVTGHKSIQSVKSYWDSQQMRKMHPLTGEKSSK